MTRPVADLPGMVTDLAGAISAGKKQTVMDAALVVKDEFLAGPPRSGLKKGASPGSKRAWNAGFDIKGGANPTALVKYRGNVHWTERGTDPHFIVASAYGRGRRSRVRNAEAGTLGSRRFQGAKAIKTPFGLRAWAIHPGQKARPFFSRVKDLSGPAAIRTVRSGLRRNMARSGFQAAARFR